jgi:tetratricopeptide (TPR) repeat protein
MKWWMAIVCFGVILLARPALAQDGAQMMETPITVSSGLFESAQQALNAGEFDRALLDVSLFVLLNPTYSQGYFLRGVIYANRAQDGDIVAALSSMEQALALAEGDNTAPEYRAALYNTRASIHLVNEDNDSAFADYGLSLAEVPNIDAYINRAVLYARQEDFENALADIDAAIVLAGDDAEQAANLFLLRASINNSRGEIAAAASSYFEYVQSIVQDLQELEALPPGSLLPLQMAAGRVYVIPFRAQAGQILSAVAASAEDSSVDPLLIVMSPAGEPLVASDDVSGEDLTALVQNYLITETGVYALVITHAGGMSEGDMLVGVQLDGG